MSKRHYAQRASVRQAIRRGINSAPRVAQRARRAQLGTKNLRDPFAPPEDWHEPTGAANNYKIVVQNPGPGYRHVVTPNEVRERLTRLPQQLLESLEVIQLSRMTRKKQSFPCYGMQWGATLYLYPLEESLEELFHAPPRPEVVNEAKMYGGQWDEPEVGVWRLRWNEVTIRDFYLNNILIHELGHLVDDRNTGYDERERYAEWFAIEYGYRATGGAARRRGGRSTRRRHHSV